jgi:hypothetical protein
MRNIETATLQGIATDGPPHVGQRVVVHCVSRIGLARETIFEREGGDAARAQVAGEVMTFVVGPQLTMPAARRDDDGGACGLLFRRQVRRDRRSVNVRHGSLAVLGKSAAASGPDLPSEPGAPLGHSRISFVWLADRIVAGNSENARRARRSGLFFILVTWIEL